MIFIKYDLVENVMTKMIYKATEQILIELLANFAMTS